MSVALIHWRRVDWVADAVASVLTSDVPVEVLVVNNSAEDHNALTAIVGERATVITPGPNLGYTGAANLALARWLHSGIGYGVVAAHDLLVEPDTLRRLSESLRDHRTFGAVGPVVTNKVAGAGSATDGASSMDAVVVEWLPGSCLMMRRDCVLDVGGFDAAYGSYVEDADWCLRARSAGWQIGLVAEARAMGRGTGDPTAEAHARINRVRFAWRHRGLLAATREYSRLVAGASVALWDAHRRNQTEPIRTRRARALSRSALDVHRIVSRQQITPPPAAAPSGPVWSRSKSR